MGKGIEGHPQKSENTASAHELFDALVAGDLKAAQKLENEVKDTIDTHWAERVYPLRDEISEFVSELGTHFNDAGEQQRVIEALRLMFDVHVDQKNRIDGTSVVSHTLAVGYGVLRNYPTATSDEVIAALLHDSIEDRPTLLAKMGRDVDLAKADEGFLRSEARAFIQQRFGDRVANLVHGLTSPLPYPHDDDLDYEAPTSSSVDIYREYMHSLLASGDSGLIAIKWEDARQNLPLDNLEKNLVKSGNGQEVGETTKKSESLRRKYGPVLKHEWLSFWRDIVDTEHSLYAQREESLTFIEHLLRTDYKEKD